MKKIQKNKAGFSLVEVLIVALIITFAFSAFYTVSTVGTRYIIQAKNELGATAFANEKMEIIRNLAYDDVGIIGGIPNGKIPQDEDVTNNGHDFHVHTLIQYQDDPLDGVYPADVIPNDYKVAKISVSWKNSAGINKEVVSLSRFVPPGLETLAGGAPLAINVKGDNGEAVKQASVHIVNNDVSPAIDFTVQTDNDGHIMIPAAPVSMSGYYVTVSKNGYETVATLDSPSLDYLSSPYTPTYKHISVLLGFLNVFDFIQNELSNLTIKTVDYAGNPIGDINFTLNGGKVLGRDALNVDVFNVHEAGSTDLATGEKKYSNISSGNYNIIATPDSQHEIADYTPVGSPVALVPGASLTYEIKLVDKDLNGLLVDVVDNDTLAPVVDAKISLTDSLSVDVFSNKDVSGSGILYYPDTSTPLSSGIYSLKIESPAYTTQTISGVNINKLTKEHVKLVKP